MKVIIEFDEKVRGIETTSSPLASNNEVCLEILRYGSDKSIKIPLQHIKSIKRIYEVNESDVLDAVLGGYATLTCENCGENLNDKFIADKPAGILFIDPGENNYPHEPDVPPLAYFYCHKCFYEKLRQELRKAVAGILMDGAILEWNTTKLQIEIQNVIDKVLGVGGISKIYKENEGRGENINNIKGDENDE